MRYTCVIFLIVLCVTSLAAAAEPGTRGRFPDGRAFRTDVQGTQIVDYIAELELSLEQQERRLRGLEYELEEKQRVIERFKGRRVGKDGLVERDLVMLEDSSEQAREAQVMGERVLISGTVPGANTEDGFVSPATTDALLCSQEECSQHLNVMREKLYIARESTEIDRQVFLVEKEEMNGQILSLQKKLTERDVETQILRSKLSETSDTAKLQMEDALQRARAEVQQADSRTQALKLEQAGANQPRLLAANAPVNERAGTSDTIRASIKPDELSGVPGAYSAKAVVREVKIKAAPRAPRKVTLSKARLQAIETLKGSLKTELNKISSLMTTRRKLFADYAKSGRKGVIIKPSKALSSNKRSIEMVSAGLDKAVTVRDLAVYQRDIRDIRNTLNEDIALVKRMQRLG